MQRLSPQLPKISRPSPRWLKTSNSQVDNTWFDRQTSIDNLLANLLAEARANNQGLVRILDSLRRQQGLSGQSIVRSTVVETVGVENTPGVQYITDWRDGKKYKVKRISFKSAVENVPILAFTFDTPALNATYSLDFAIMSVSVTGVSANSESAHVLFGRNNKDLLFSDNSLDDAIDPTALVGFNPERTVTIKADLWHMPLIFKRNSDRVNVWFWNTLGPGVQSLFIVYEIAYLEEVI